MDPLLFRLRGVPDTHDTVEGEIVLLPQCQQVSSKLSQSKLALPNGASLLDSNAKGKLKLGLFSYPVLQAADVLVHRYVPSLE